MSNYTAKRISNYEGFKRLDKMQEKIAEGKLLPPRRAERDFYCPLCHYRKRSQRVIKSEILGSRLPQILHATTKGSPVANPFDASLKVIVVCGDCAGDLERSGVR